MVGATAEEWVFNVLVHVTSKFMGKVTVKIKNQFNRMLQRVPGACMASVHAPGPLY